MLILGVNIGHDSSATLLKDGAIICNISLDLLNREKHKIQTEVNFSTIDYVLKSNGVKRGDIDLIVYSSLKWSIPRIFEKIEEDLKTICQNVKFIPHHLAHACSTYYASPFDESVVFISDGAGSPYEEKYKEFFNDWKWKDNETNLMVSYKEAETAFYFSGVAKEEIYKRWQLRESWDNPDEWGDISLGSYYTLACKHAKLRNYGTAQGKLMGLAPYGEVRNRNKKKKVPKLYKKNKDKVFSLTMDTMKPLFRLPNETFDDVAHVAHVAQKNLEDILISISNELYKRKPCKNICIAGGVGLNSVANEKILKNTPFENIFIVPPSNDSGLAIGCAYFGYYEIEKGTKRPGYTQYNGKEYSSEEIKQAIKNIKNIDNKVDYINLGEVENIEKIVAKFINDGKVVGWFQGKSETGPRALGNRSILADPRNPTMRDYLNDKVKLREGFRPFAPAVMREHATEYFEMEDIDLPFMLRVVDVKISMRSIIPAVTHVDGSARVQTVRKEQNERFYNLINEFKELSGIPILLNTSFNGPMEPIVESPEDALNDFLKLKIDVLAIGDYLLIKGKNENLYIRKKNKIKTNRSTNRGIRK